MIHAYEDEDNAPMYGDVPLPYPIRTWEEIIKAWEGEHMTEQLTMYDAVAPVPCMWECVKTCKHFGEKVDHPSWWHDGSGRCLLPKDKDIETPVFDNRCFIYCKLYEPRG